MDEVQTRQWDGHRRAVVAVTAAAAVALSTPAGLFVAAQLGAWSAGSLTLVVGAATWFAAGAVAVDAEERWTALRGTGAALCVGAWVLGLAGGLAWWNGAPELWVAIGVLPFLGPLAAALASEASAAFRVALGVAIPALCGGGLLLTLLAWVAVELDRWSHTPAHFSIP